MAERPSYRLPHTVEPRRYRLEIAPDLPGGVFHGTAEIEVDVREPVQEFILNAFNLTISDVTLRGAGGEMSGTVAYQIADEQATLSWPQQVSPGSWTLVMTFDGVLSLDLRGFYRTTVNDAEGQPVVIASTHCEATDARRIFPCWDEPEFKARFAIAVVADPDLTVLSNGREVSQEIEESGKRRVVFAETMPMSTYLVALVVGPLELSPPDTVNQVMVRVAARRGYSHLTDVAQTAAAGTLRFFEEYFGIPYPADKIDHVAVPEFSAGAMENLGCVIYREELLLIDSDRSSPMEQENVVSTIAHETAHMWFGDLVTMRWWNGIWLNEAFATFMQVLATDALHPEWDVWTTFGQGRAYALSVDALASTRPIEYPVGPPVESWGMFDVLTYQKGGSVLRMLEQYLGPDVFRKGIHHYLVAHRYGNTETSDLWDALEEASGEPVRQVMDSWVFQGGYPLIRAEWQRDAHQLRLMQHQFRYQGDGNGIWQVPIVLGISRRDGTRETVQVLLGAEPATIPLPEDLAWVLINQGGWGFYRVAYDQALWDRLMGALGEMTGSERLRLVDDVWASVLAGEAPLTHAVQLWRTLTTERDPDVWSAVARNWRLINVVADDAGRAALQQLVQDIARPVFEELTWAPAPGENVRRGRLRAIMVDLLGTTGADPKVRAEARERWVAHIEGSATVPPELLTPLAEVVAAAGGAGEWDLLYQAFKSARTPQDETRYLFALSHFQSPDVIRRTLDLYQSSEVRLQDGLIAIAYSLANRHASEITWNLIEDHWDEILEKYPKSMVQYLAQPVASIVEDRLAERTASWLRAHPVEEVARFVEQTLEFQAINRGLVHRVKGQWASMLQAGR